jgi:O-acetyl-ADP-ribose deacetylase (regulator of RNase III)
MIGYSQAFNGLYGIKKMEKSALIKVKGNLLDMADNGDFDIIIQGCNCFNAMGAGLAPQIAKRYPLAEAVDSDTRRGSISKLGNWTMAYSTNDNPNQKDFRIINAYTQYVTSQQGEDVFEYASFEVILRKLAHEYGAQRYGLPYIGMGLAGGDKKRIMAMIENFAITISAKGGTVTLVEFG